MEGEPFKKETEEEKKNRKRELETKANQLSNRISNPNITERERFSLEADLRGVRASLGRLEEELKNL